MQLIFAALPVGIGHDRLAAHFVEGDVLRRMARGAGDGHHGAHALGIGRRPLQRLHPAHRAADHRQQFFDSQGIDQHGLRPHHVAHGDQREMQPEGLAGRRIDFGGAGRAHAAANDIGADHEEAVGVDGLARSHHGRPPAGLAGDGMIGGDELVAGQGMADQDGVALVGVERAIGHIGDGEGRQACGRNPASAACRPKVHGLADIGLRRGHRAQEFGASVIGKSLGSRS